MFKDACSRLFDGSGTKSMGCTFLWVFLVLPGERHVAVLLVKQVAINGIGSLLIELKLGQQGVVRAVN